MSIADTLRSRGWIPVAALLLAVLVTKMPLAGRVEQILDDMQQGLAAREVYFKDAVVLDIDETSLNKLRPYFGDWPYSRDVHALVLDYLNEMGASCVVFDILLTDVRAKDAVLAASLKRHGNAVLVAATPTATDTLSVADATRLTGLSWSVPAAVPRPHWPSILLPTPELLASAPDTAIAVVAAVADADGILRRLPLVHEVAGSVLPSLPLAAMASRHDKRTLVTDGDRWGVESAKWPIDADGFVHLYFPANTNSVLALSFHEVAEAALGVVKIKEAASFFKGKTVFVGSTAYLSDRVNTPRGPTSGTYALAIAHQSMKQGWALRSPTLMWNSLLMVPAVLALFWLALDRRFSGRGGIILILMCGGVIYSLHFGLLALAMQQAALLPPLLVLALGWLILLIREQIELKQRTRKLEFESSMDSLTGLPVRRAFLRMFEQAIASAVRFKRPLSVAILDLDHFKKVNDTYGHPVGDLVLKRFAEVLQRTLRNVDVAGRWGGEEFVVFLPETDAEGAKVILEKVRQAISEEQFPGPADSLRVTMSAGLTRLASEILDPEEIIGLADKALYEAKESGRNRICLAGKSSMVALEGRSV